jgi:pimeloyl-ACP methyl ester carboxylesterase
VTSPRPIWIGDARRPAFGWWHQPDGGRFRGGVVVCPPLGLDYIQSHYALRVLADDLSARGFCVVRLDYDGMGDSAGDNDDPGRLDAWLRTVRSAISLMRRCGVTDVSLVGMRFGAMLAAEAAATDHHVEQVVLWDPCTSGKRFLAEQRAMSTMTLGRHAGRPDGSVEGPGLVYDVDTAQDIRRMSISHCPTPLARRVLVLTRPGQPVEPALVNDSLAIEPVTQSDAAGQHELLELVVPFQKLPREAMHTIEVWLSDGARRWVEGVATPPPAGTATVGHDARGRSIVETPVAIPPVGLFGILTEIEGGVVPGTPTALFMSVALEHRVGPARTWVSLSRQLAAAGIRCLRFDLSGLGDSPHRRPGDHSWVALRPDGFDDVVDATRWISPDDPSNVILVGLCASGYQALESALDLRPRGVIAVNPVLSFVPAERLAGMAIDRRRRIALPKDAVAPVFRQGGRLETLRERYPDLAWRVRILASFRRRSGRWLTRLVRQGTDVFLVCGDKEHRQIRMGISAIQLKHLLRSGRLHFEHMADLQHGLLTEDHRRLVTGLISTHVTSQCLPESSWLGGPPTPSPHARSQKRFRAVTGG